MCHKKKKKPHRILTHHLHFSPFFIFLSEDTLDCACLKLIDFGRSVDMTLFPAGTTFTTNCYTEDFQCIEMKEGRPWTTQVTKASRKKNYNVKTSLALLEPEQFSVELKNLNRKPIKAKVDIISQ